MTAINSLTDFKRVLQTPGVKIKGISHWREGDEKISHFISRFKTARSITHVKRNYFDIDGGSRLDLTAKAGWVFDGTNRVVLRLNPPACNELVYEVIVPAPQSEAA